MKLLRAVLPLLLGAAPAEVPLGKFEQWSSWEKRSLSFTSDGVTVMVEALPCPDRPPHSDDSTCSWDGYNNQAAVMVSAPGMRPLRVLTDGGSSYARIAVMRFDAREPRPGVIVESQSGGSAGDMTAQVVLPDGNGFRAVPLADSKVRLQGEIADFPRDVSGDGRIDLQLEDGDFAYVFGCGACTPRPPRLFAVRSGHVVDESSDPALRPVFARDMVRLAPRCLSKERYRNGACAAYVADAARAGRFKVAWAQMLRHYERGERELWSLPNARNPATTFPASLRAFLRHTGYLPA